MTLTIVRPVHTVSPTGPSDVSLVARIAVGDDRALQMVYERYSPLVYGLFWLLVAGLAAVLGLWPGSLDYIARVAGIAYSPALLLLAYAGTFASMIVSQWRQTLCVLGLIAAGAVYYFIASSVTNRSA